MHPRCRNKILALAESPAHVAAHQHHVRGVAGLAAGLDVRLRKHRPEPMLVVAVRLLNAGGRPAISLVTGRAAELVRIMGLQQLRFGMAGEGPRIVVGLVALRRHRCRGQLDGLADPHVAGFAAIHNVGVGHVDLHDRPDPTPRSCPADRESVPASGSPCARRCRRRASLSAR